MVLLRILSCLTSHHLLHIDGGVLETGDGLLGHLAILSHHELAIELPSQPESDSIY